MKKEVLKMKKKVYVIFILIVILLINVLLFACDKPNKLKIISVVSGNEYSFDIETNTYHSGGDFRTFTTNLTLIEMKECLKNQGSSSEMFSDNSLFISKNINKTRKDYFVIAKLSNDKSYQLMSSVAFDEKSGAYVLFPIHLLNMKSSDLLEAGEVYFFITGTEYQLNSDIDSVVDFYENSGIFTINETKESINLNLIDGEFVHKHSQSNIAINLRESEDSLFITVNIIYENQ